MPTIINNMNKYTEKNEGIRNMEVYNSIPKNLARTNNNFKYSIANK